MPNYVFKYYIFINCVLKLLVFKLQVLEPLNKLNGHCLLFVNLLILKMLNNRTLSNKKKKNTKILHSQLRVRLAPQSRNSKAHF
jgi:hypothetical protein